MGMIRILDMPAFLKHCLKHSSGLIFDYVDEILPSNTGHYHCAGENELTISALVDGESTPLRSTAEVLELLAQTSFPSKGIALPLFFDR